MSTVTRARTVRHTLALAARRHTGVVAFAAVVGPGVLAGLSDDDRPTSSSTSATGQTTVSAVDAERMLSIVGNDTLTPIAADGRQRLAAVVERTVR